jgi:mannose-6-phosphate isomerase-like protein (cupin superfamily)
MQEIKGWGVTEEIYRDKHLLIARIQVEAGGYCSIHYHRQRDNLFVVHAGTLIVHVFDSGPPKSVRLNAGDQLRVPAGIAHQFEAATVVRCDEVYTPVAGATIDADDIVRFSQGGMRTHDAKKHEPCS